MRHIITLIILLAPHIAYGQEQMFRIYNPNTIYYDPSNQPQVFKGGVTYLPTTTTDEDPFFQSDFEDASISTNSATSIKILGATWESLDTKPEIGSYYIVTEGYDTTIAHPRILSMSGSNVLRFQVLDSYGTKARVQGELTFDVDTITELRVQYKIYIPSSLQLLANYTTGTEYIKLAEIWDDHEDTWDGNTAGQAYWRFGLRTNPLVWFFDGYLQQPVEVRDQLTFARITNNTVAIPYDQWATLDYTFHRGEGENGHVLVTLNYGGTTYTIFDATGNTSYPGHPLPVRSYQPMKFYMSSNIENYLDEGDVSLYYDDFKLWLK